MRFYAELLGAKIFKEPSVSLNLQEDFQKQIDSKWFYVSSLVGKLPSRTLVLPLCRNDYNGSIFALYAYYHLACVLGTFHLLKLPTFQLYRGTLFQLVEH